MDTVNLSAAPARSGNSAADARERARAFLDGLLPPVTSEAAGTVLLVVSELVT
ncbi:ATP-binding protein, partial [Kitasatospora aureofaciens]